MRKKKTRFMVESALIAALYAGLTYLCAFLVPTFTYGPIQFRFSEALTVLPLLTPAAIPGLTVGCFFGNLLSFNPLDLVFGTLATLISAGLTFALKKCGTGLALLPPVLVNAGIIGAEIAFFYTAPATFGGSWAFAASALSVAIGQTVVCYGLGIPLLLILKKYRLFSADNSVGTEQNRKGKHL